jgi:hypothetical protein
MKQCSKCYATEQDHEDKFQDHEDGWLCEICLTEKLREAGRIYRELADLFYRRKP